MSEDGREMRIEEMRKTSQMGSLPQCEETPPGGTAIGPHQRWEIGRHHGWLRSKHLPMMTCVPAREGWDEHLFADAIFRVIFGRWIHAMI